MNTQRLNDKTRLYSCTTGRVKYRGRKYLLMELLIGPDEILLFLHPFGVLPPITQKHKITRRKRPNHPYSNLTVNDRSTGNVHNH